MVRVKNRYIAFKILYPPEDASSYPDYGLPAPIPVSPQDDLYTALTNQSTPTSSLGTPGSSGLFGPSASPSTPLLAMYKSTQNSVTQKHIAGLIKQQLLLNFGEFGHGVAAPALSVKYFSNRTSTGIVKVGRDEQCCEMVCFALMCVNTLSVPSGATDYKTDGAMTAGAGVREVPVIFQVQRVSGTIRKAQDFLIEENKDLVAEILAVTG